MASHDGSVVAPVEADGPRDTQILPPVAMKTTFLYISNIGSNPGFIGLSTPANIPLNPGDPPLVWRTSNPDGTGVPQGYVTGYSLLGTSFAIMTVYADSQGLSA